MIFIYLFFFKSPHSLVAGILPPQVRRAVQCASPGMGSSLRAAVSTVDGGCVMCSVGGVWGELVCTGISSDWRLPSTWFWVGVFWRGK